METVSELGLGEDEAGDEVAEEAEAADDGDEEAVTDILVVDDGGVVLVVRAADIRGGGGHRPVEVAVHPAAARSAAPAVTFPWNQFASCYAETCCAAGWACVS